jgi:hypothetical protein
MSDRLKQVMLPFASLPTTEGVRSACANVIRDIQREHDLTDLQLAETIGVHANTISRTRRTPDCARAGRARPQRGSQARHSAGQAA